MFKAFIFFRYCPFPFSTLSFFFLRMSYAIVNCKLPFLHSVYYYYYSRQFVLMFVSEVFQHSFQVYNRFLGNKYTWNKFWKCGTSHAYISDRVTVFLSFPTPWWQFQSLNPFLIRNLFTVFPPLSPFFFLSLILYRHHLPHPSLPSLFFLLIPPLSTKPTDNISKLESKWIFSKVKFLVR